MKKLLLFSLALSSSVAIYAQKINRKALIEEYTSATCPPCASQNPAFNALILPNRDVKAVPVKYQVPIPSAGDPMYAQNQAESDARRSYYGISGAPTATINGIIPDNNNTPGGAWSGYAGGPYGYTQTVIDNAFNNLTQFSMVLDHTISTDLDSVFVTVTITNVDTVAATYPDIKLRIALLEETITFSSPAATNGETVFEEVMRKMIPNATGTTLPSTWAPGADTTITLAALVPSYIYDFTEMSMAAWLQVDATKEVLQADYNDPAAVQGNDAALVLNTLNNSLCETAIAPEVTLTNESDNALTTIELEVSVNGNSVGTESWTGTLAAGASTNYALTGTYSVSTGSNDVEVRIISVENGIDLSNSNNAGSETVVVVSTTADPYPFSLAVEGLALYDFPAGAYENNADGMGFGAISNAAVNGLTQELGGFGNSTHSIFWYFFNAPSGDVADFTLDPVDLTNATDVSLSFSHAYAQYQAESDLLRVDVSTNCGDTWNQIFAAAGSVLATAPATTSQFWPTAAQWTANKVSLDPYIGSEVIFRFRGVSNFGNNMFIDDIAVLKDTVQTQIDGETVYVIDGENFVKSGNDFYPLGTNEIIGSTFAVYPNPATEVLNISGVEGLTNVIVYDMQGREVTSVTTETSTISVANLNAGVYMLSIENAGKVATTRVTVVK